MGWIGLGTIVKAGTVRAGICDSQYLWKGSISSASRCVSAIPTSKEEALSLTSSSELLYMGCVRDTQLPCSACLFRRDDFLFCLLPCVIFSLVCRGVSNGAVCTWKRQQMMLEHTLSG